MADSAERYNSVLEIINERLIPDATAKKARGEVFTPLNLVREMLFGIRKSAVEKLKGKMPHPKSEEYLELIWGINDKGDFIDEKEDDRVGGIPLDLWRNPETKWLDPANGIGNFPVVAFYMLDYQLGKHGPEKFKGDKHKLTRRKHIIENMLYMIELDKGNVNTAKKIFNKIVPGVTANICCTDTLKITDEKLKSVFKGVNRFHVVMGNPPFNDDLENNPIGHAQDTGLWEKFVKLSIDIFMYPKTGLLAFIHPPRWRQPNHSLHNIMFSKQFIFLGIFNKKDGNKYFDAVTRFDYYILMNDVSSKVTPVKFEDNIISNIHIRTKTPFIANYGHDIWEKIIDTKVKTLDVLGGGSSIKYTSADHSSDDSCPQSKPFLNINTTSKTSKVKKGLTYKKIKKNSNSNIIYVDIVCSSNEHPLTKKKKVIFSKNEVVYSFYDNGKYGLTSNAFCILVNTREEADIIIKYINSKLFKYLIASVKFGNYSTAKNIFEYIPNPLLFKGEMTEVNIHKNLELDAGQRERINTHTIIENEESSKGGSRNPARVTRRKARN